MKAKEVIVERLNCGMRAAFITMPHYRTHAARLVIHSGAMHEDSNAKGSAHVLKCSVKKGTNMLPTEEKMNRYLAENYLQGDNITRRDCTIYAIQGRSLESVGGFVTQLAFDPVLSDEAIEETRQSVIASVRQAYANPYEIASVFRSVMTRGERYGYPLMGTVDDLQHITPGSIRNYHRRYYQPRNATLVLASSEPVEKQRETIEKIMATYPHIDEGGTPSSVCLDEFNPAKKKLLSKKIDVPTSNPSMAGVVYDLPDILRANDAYSYKMLSAILSSAMSQRLYGMVSFSNTNVTMTSDLSFDNNRNWSELSMNANVHSKVDVPTVLDVMGEVVTEKIADSVFQAAKEDMIYEAESLLEGTPDNVAENVAKQLSLMRRERLALDEAKSFAKIVTQEEIETRREELLAKYPLVTITSPR